MTAVRITASVGLPPKGYFIQWTTDDATESGQYVFELFRSGGPVGPWEPVTGPISNTYSHFDDFTVPTAKTTALELRPNLFGLFREFVYRIVMTSPSGKTYEAIADIGANFDGAPADVKMNQYLRKIIRDFRLTLKFNGTPCMLLKRRRWGVRCVCVDKATKEIMRASCKKCWGTGLVGGYWAPFPLAVRRNTGTNGSVIAPAGKGDSNDVKFWMADFPNVEQDDLLVFLKDQRRFRLDQATQTEIRLRLAHQVVSAQEIEHGNILYQLPVRLDQSKPLY